MRVVAWGVYDLGKPRPRILLAGLEAAGVEIVALNAPIWAGVEDKSRVRGLGARLVLVLRWLFAYPGLLWRYLRAPAHDVVLVGYPGIFDVLMVAPLVRMRGAALVWDVFLGLYETVVEDRRLLAPRSLTARLLATVERFAARRADCLILDTRAHAEAFAEYVGRGRRPPPAEAVFVGAEEIFHPRVEAAVLPAVDGVSCRVLFYGQMIPLHGVSTLLAASRLTPPEVDWILIGRGQDDGLVERFLSEHEPHNLRWIPWVPYDELPGWIRAADICLGIFGDTDKAARVIPNKVFQILAGGRPLVTRDSPAVRELLDGTEPGVELVPPGDPEALAAAVTRLAKERPASADNVGARFAPRRLGHEARAILQRAIEAWKGRR